LECEENVSTTKLPTTRLPKETPIGSAYVPYQTWEEPMSAEDALNHGTIFTELNLPFLCVGGANYD
jgi:hypothetical protein